MEIKVSFLFIGPDKSGSSWLYKLLLAHPDCFVPRIKDIYYFDRYYSNGVEWYHKRFAKAAPGCEAVGELSHDYLFSLQACRRIYEYNPRVKLLTCLRDPVDRSFSHYLYLKRSGLTRRPLIEAIADFPEIIHNSQYNKHLVMYYERFESSQIKVLFFEELKDDPWRFAHEALDFIGLSSVVELPEKERAAAKPRSHTIARIMKIGANLSRALGVDGLVGLVKESALSNILYSEYAPGEKPSLTVDERCFLVDSLSDVKSETEKILGYKIPYWNK